MKQTLHKEYMDITDKLKAQRFEPNSLSESEVLSLIKRHEELTKALESLGEEYDNETVITKMSHVFATADSPHTYGVEVEIEATSVIVDTDILYYSIEDIKDIKILATDVDSKETFSFDHERIAKAFDYYAGNVKDGIIEYFDWNYIYFLFLEELA